MTFYAEWKTMWPSSEAKFLEANGHAPSAQEVLFEGMLSPANLLDLVQNFVVFELPPRLTNAFRKNLERPERAVASARSHSESRPSHP